MYPAVSPQPALRGPRVEQARELRLQRVLRSSQPTRGAQGAHPRLPGFRAVSEGSPNYRHPDVWCL